MENRTTDSTTLGENRSNIDLAKPGEDLHYYRDMLNALLQDPYRVSSYCSKHLL
jgi:hypothetical protein